MSARAASLLAMQLAGATLSPDELAEVRAAYSIPADPAPPAPPLDGFTLHAETARATKLSKADEERYSKLYRKQWRQLRRWIDKGEASGEPCPLHDPRLMPGWWSRHFKHRVPSEIEEAAVAAAISAAASPPPASSDRQSPAPDRSMPDPAGVSSSNAASAVAVPPPVGKVIDLESFDPEEGDRLRELKQIQAARFAELKAEMLGGRETTLAEGRYLKLTETIDKIETRVIERMKKRGLYILRVEIERDLAANAELLRQLDDSQERRILENCSTLSADQRLEVGLAIRESNKVRVRILSQLDSLDSNGLRLELARVA